MRGRRLKDSPIGQFPLVYEDLQPGDYWKVLTSDGERPLNIIEHPEDRAYWRLTDEQVSGNLTGTVWGVMTPRVGQNAMTLHGMLSIHTVREHEDGTISVIAGDGSSNSIKVTRREDLGEVYHGYIDHGEWTAC